MEKKEKCEWLYISGKSLREISKEVELCTKTISKYLRRRGFLIRVGSSYTKKNFFNENYFEKIDCKEKAYFLGLLYADGSVYFKRKRVQINLKNEDVSILEKFAKEIEHTGKLYSDRGKYTALILSSGKMMNDVIKLGCVERKSLILKFPTKDQVPREFISHFIRGYFDGDGSITVRNKKFRNVSFTSSEEFLNSISKVLLEEAGIPIPTYHKRHKNKEISAGSIYISVKENIRKLREFMYKDSEEVYLKRKYEKFEI